MNTDNYTMAYNKMSAWCHRDSLTKDITIYEISETMRAIDKNGPMNNQIFRGHTKVKGKEALWAFAIDAFKKHLKREEDYEKHRRFEKERVKKMCKEDGLCNLCGCDIIGYEQGDEIICMGCLMEKDDEIRNLVKDFMRKNEITPKKNLNGDFDY